MIIAALANVLLVLQCEYWSFIIYGSKHIWLFVSVEKSKTL